MKDALRVGEPLPEREARNPQGVGACAQGLKGAASPAASLTDQGRGSEWSQSCAQLLRQEETTPTCCRQPDSCRQILRGCPGFEATHIQQGPATHHERRAGTNHGIQPLTHRFDPAVETLLVREQPALEPQVADHGVGVHVGLRGLHQADCGVCKTADRTAEKRLHRHHIGIEYGEKLALQLRQHMVEVPRFGMVVLEALPVTTAESSAERLQLRTTHVIKQPNNNTGIGHGSATPKTAFHHRKGLTAGGDQNIHPGSRETGHTPVHRGPGSAGHLGNQGEQQQQQPVGEKPELSGKHQTTEPCDPGAGEIERFTNSPMQIAERQERRQEHCPGNSVQLLACGDRAGGGQVRC